MTAAEFKSKWARFSGKETSAYQEHFTDLCRLLNHPTPAAADPTGSESFCFQKRVVKDAELFAFKEDGSVAETEEAAEARLCRRVEEGTFSAGNTRASAGAWTKPTSNCSATARACSTRPCSSSAISTATSSAPTSTAPSRKPTSSPMTRLTARRTCGFSTPLSRIPIT